MEGIERKEGLIFYTNNKTNREVNEWVVNGFEKKDFKCVELSVLAADVGLLCVTLKAVQFSRFPSAVSASGSGSTVE